jgi:hypothetical protein
MKTTRLSNNASREELLKAHLVKMGAKKIVRNRMYEQMKGPNYIRANIGVNHPDYGMTFAEHFEEKAKRIKNSS